MLNKIILALDIIAFILFSIISVVCLVLGMTKRDTWLMTCAIMFYLLAENKYKEVTEDIEEGKNG